jgi:hypothetical protein
MPYRYKCDRLMIFMSSLLCNDDIRGIQEDVPEEFANLVLNFISRNRIGPHGVEIPGMWKPSQQTKT